MSRCDLCWVEFPTDEDLAKHVEMEEMVDWPIDGLKIAGGSGRGVPNPSGRSHQYNPGGVDG
jgi:hypothetical protein